MNASDLTQEHVNLRGLLLVMAVVALAIALRTLFTSGVAESTIQGALEPAAQFALR